MRLHIPGKLFALVLMAAIPAAGTAPAVARETPESFAPLAKELLPGVVNISTTKEVEGRQSPFEQLPPGHPLRKFFEQFQSQGEQPKRTLRSLGSGFIVDADGYVVTNHHVIAEADAVTVVLNDDTRLDAEIVGSDPETDLALLKVAAKRDLPALSWGESEAAQVGDWSLAIGNPFGLGGTVTAGIVSARGRDINAGPYSRFIQTDTAINRGNSGGPLFDMDGEVIGVNTAILSPNGGSVGVGFALPARVAEPIVAELRADGEVTRGWLGVSVQPVTQELAEGLDLPSREGALVGSVTKDSPAAKAGLQSGDVIVGFDDKPVADSAQLAWRSSQRDPGDEVSLTLFRDGTKREITVTLGELDDGDPSAETAVPEEAAKLTAKALGVKVAPVSAKVREEFGLPDGTEGAAVVQVARGGPAASRGIRPGDVIARVGQKPVKTPADLHETVTAAFDKGAKGLVLLIQRGRQGQFVSVPLARPEKG